MITSASSLTLSLSHNIHALILQTQSSTAEIASLELKSQSGLKAKFNCVSSS